MKSTTLMMGLLSGMAIATPLFRRDDSDDIFAQYDDDAPIIPSGPPMASTVDTPTVSYNKGDAIATVVDDTIANQTISLKKRDGTCVVNLNTNYAGSVSADTVDAFLNDPTIASISKNAVAPPNYFLVEGYQNLQGSAENAGPYLGYWQDQINSYDTQACANQCSSIEGCVSFNIYFERDNKYDPDTSCPASATTSVIEIKCAFWGLPLYPSSATNKGQYTSNGFQIAIAGSNAYTTAPQPESSFDGPYDVGKATINAPPNTKTYLGVQSFSPSQPFDPALCAAGCLAKTAFNSRHPNADGSYNTCVFFDAYVMLKNGANPQFSCTYYSDAYDASWATNFGQTRSGNKYTVDHSYTYKLSGFPFAPSKS